MSDYALTKLYSKGGGGGHFFSHFSCFPSRFSTCFFVCLSRLSFLQYLLGTHLRFAEHLSDNAGSGQS